jgi:hypothetical protein
MLPESHIECLGKSKKENGTGNGVLEEIPTSGIVE